MEPFQLVYDYTFFCAIDPSTRQDWGRRMKELVAPGGALVCLVYPIDPTRTTGPPYCLTVDDYKLVLQDAFDLVLDQPCTQSFEDRAGHERMTVWQRH